jgi:stage II sporulation protein M
MKRFAAHLPHKSMPALIALIFLKNVLAAVLSVLAGPLLGILPFFAAMVNGVLIGVVFSYMAQTKSATSMVLSLIPHGLFELPAMCMAWGLGIWQGIWFFEKNKTGTLGERRKKALRVLLLIIVPLLLIAAIIEGADIVAGRAVK